MWYFSWVLGLGFAVTLAVLNAMWLEARMDAPAAQRRAAPLLRGGVAAFAGPDGPDEDALGIGQQRQDHGQRQARDRTPC